jgi:hypothetical protein
LRKFEEYCTHYYGKVLPTLLRLQELPFDTHCSYGVMPPDHIDRIATSEDYRAPRGWLERLPENCWYGKVLLMKQVNGKHVKQSLYYRTLVACHTHIFSDYNLCEYGELGRHPPGVLLGMLGEDDVSMKTGDFENSFPFFHYHEIVYTVVLSDCHEHNPLIIRVAPVDDGKK